MAISGILGQALTDPATGLPNMPYFSLIQDWETRRSYRRNYQVKVLALRVQGAVDRTLAWRLCQELRTTDLIASEGRHVYRILLTSPDAESARAIGARIRAMIDKLNKRRDAEPIAADLSVEQIDAPEARPGPWGPCDEPLQGQDEDDAW
jgi:GGDEF domain-containing protein